jgi:plasmid stabilization system protein ParE
MHRKVVFSKKALRELHSLLEYLESKWSEKVRHEFELKLERSINIITETPESFPKSDVLKTFINVS